MNRVVPLSAHKKPPQISVESITPEKAAQMLGTMPNPRTLRQTKVRQYAREMIAGRWLLNGEAIKFAWDGHLIDGQHRLSAVIAANRAVELLVVRGVDPSAYITLDTGAGRSYHDATMIAGRDWPREAGTIARWWLKYARGVTTTAARIAATHQELESVILAHPIIPESARFIRSLKNVQNRCHAGVQGFVHSYASEKYDREMADSFMQDLNDGAKLEKESPIYSLRARLIDAAERRLDDDYVLAVTVKAWNAWLNGEKLLVARWRRDGDRPEDFPLFSVDAPQSGRVARGRRRSARARGLVPA